MNIEKLEILRKKRRQELFRGGLSFREAIIQAKKDYPANYEPIPLKKPVSKEDREEKAFCFQCKGWVEVIDSKIEHKEGVRGTRSYLKGKCGICNRRIAKIIGNVP